MVYILIWDRLNVINIYIIINMKALIIYFFKMQMLYIRMDGLSTKTSTQTYGSHYALFMEVQVKGSWKLVANYVQNFCPGGQKNNCTTTSNEYVKGNISVGNNII